MVEGYKAPKVKVKEFTTGGRIFFILKEEGKPEQYLTPTAMRIACKLSRRTLYEMLNALEGKELEEELRKKLWCAHHNVPTRTTIHIVEGKMTCGILLAKELGVSRIHANKKLRDYTAGKIPLSKLKTPAKNKVSNKPRKRSKPNWQGLSDKPRW